MSDVILTKNGEALAAAKRAVHHAGTDHMLARSRATSQVSVRDERLWWEYGRAVTEYREALATLYKVECEIRRDALGR